MKKIEAKRYEPGDNINKILHIEIPTWLEAKLRVWADKRNLTLVEAAYRIIKNKMLKKE